jgi:hypothetical protein
MDETIQLEVECISPATAAWPPLPMAEDTKTVQDNCISSEKEK